MANGRCSRAMKDGVVPDSCYAAALLGYSSDDATSLFLLSWRSCGKLLRTPSPWEREPSSRQHQLLASQRDRASGENPI